MSTPIGDPRKAGETGTAGDPRPAGDDSMAGDPREPGQAKVKETSKPKRKAEAEDSEPVGDA